MINYHSWWPKVWQIYVKGSYLESICQPGFVFKLFIRGVHFLQAWRSCQWRYTLNRHRHWRGSCLRGHAAIDVGETRWCDQYVEDTVIDNGESGDMELESPLPLARHAQHGQLGHRLVATAWRRSRLQRRQLFIYRHY